MIALYILSIALLAVNNVYTFHYPQLLLPPSTFTSLFSTVSSTSTPFFSPPTSPSFERIDNVIMGGVSKSILSDASSYTSFKGNFREQDGGFCGFRTKPFTTPINGASMEGIYLKARLTLDQDTSKRTFKLTFRC